MNNLLLFAHTPASLLMFGLLFMAGLQPLEAQTTATQPASAPAQTVAPLPDEEALHQELRDMKKIYEDAVNSGDMTPLAPIFNQETSGVVALNQEFHSLQEMQKIFDDFKKDLGPGYVYRVKLNPERSQIFGDIAVARGTSDEYAKSYGHEYNLTTRWTAVLRRENGHWRLIRSQVTMDPLHNSVLDAIISSITWTSLGWGAAVGAVVGLIAGFGLGRLGRKAA
jgi:ketosteroid isomerase-like protein